MNSQLPSRPDIVGDQNPPWIERSVASLLSLFGTTISIFIRLLTRPWTAVAIATNGNTAAPPLSFLIVSTLWAGLQSRAFLLYEGRSVDAGVMDVFMEAASSWGPQEIFMLSVPVVAIVVMTGITAARWTLRTQTYFGNPVLRAVCYAAGMQLLSIGLILSGILAIRAVPGIHRLLKPILFHEQVLLALACLIVCIPALQLERVIATLGQTRVSRNVFSRVGLSSLTALTVGCGVVTTGMMTFGFQTFLKRGRVEAVRSESVQYANCGVIASVISKKVMETPDGLLDVEQVVMLTNITEKRWAVPRPESLGAELDRLSFGRPTIELPVESCSIDWDGEHGWVLEPGQTRILQWTIRIPEPLRDSSVVVARFYCAEVELDAMIASVDNNEEDRYARVLVDWNGTVSKAAPTQVSEADDSARSR